MENEKQKKNRLLLIVPLLLLLLLIILLLSFFLCKETKEETSPNEDLQVSGVQVQLGNKTSKHSNRTTRILGDDCREIDEENPYVYLRNDASNAVYLQFDIYCEDKLLYSSDLIEPGMMEEIDVYEMLKKGDHQLEYHISSYDLETKQGLLAGIKQLKQITIS